MLLELQSRFSAKSASFFDATASHGFTDQLVDDIVKNATRIFTFGYLQQNFSIYSTKHAMDVLEVDQELFEDIHLSIYLIYLSNLSKKLLFYKLTGCKNTAFLQKYIFVKKRLFYVKKLFFTKYIFVRKLPFYVKILLFYTYKFP